MKALITAVTLALASSSAAATGFSPWTDAAAATDPITTQQVSVEAAGFGPWRDRAVTVEVSEGRVPAEVAITQGQLNIFRPWS
jgi:hypothetical protein